MTWRPISLLFKNNLASDSPFFGSASHTHNLLRVLESVRAEHGDEPIGALYTAYGERIHHGRTVLMDPAEALREVGLPERHAAAMTDASWDETIRTQMDDGLSLTGNDVGTPILGFRNEAGKRVGFFGPVISRRLPLADGLRLWDGMMLMGGIDSFWELKRTRTEHPDFRTVD